MIDDMPDICKYCDGHLHRQDKSTRRVLKIWDGDAVLAAMVDVRCQRCGHTTTIWHTADMLPTANMARLMAEQRGRKVHFPQRRLFGCVPAIRGKRC